MALKVFGGLTFDGGKQLRTIVATSSRTRAAELVGVSANEIKNYWGQTFNPHEVATAMAQPGIVFKATSIDSDDFSPVIA